MTIALGILASDGVVIASDREETSFSDTKYSQNKIRGSQYAAGADLRQMLLAGAGDAHLIDVFAQVIEEDVLKDERLVDRPRLVFDDALERFHTQKVAPRQATPGWAGFQLVMAYQGDNRTHLFTSLHNAVLESRSFVVTGVGAMVAQPILSRFINTRRVSVKEAVVIASYAVLEAKEAVQNVGKDTDVLALFNDGRLSRTGPHNQGRLDDALRTYRLDIEPMVFRAITGVEPSDDVAVRIATLRDTLADLLGDSFAAAPLPETPNRVE